MNIIYGMGRLQRLLHNNEYVGPPFFGVFFVISILRVGVEVNGLTENRSLASNVFVYKVPSCLFCLHLRTQLALKVILSY